MGRDGAVVYVGRGVVDRGYYEIVGLGNVLGSRPVISIWGSSCPGKGNYPAAVIFDPYCVLLLVYAEITGNGGSDS